ncbi:hypothetical protein PRABACTJOHN_00345 [Parabacteroides johnsonii DSM 18315]|uniref:Uncharacterized protein n=1 Tax=Parabacteroides johnsonii DSM 18315 TaxID=537006 RepID=B7B5Q1_9BACT|nr:hypothetical protein PRABACTJOHN_00345 [Parabacteroides johnsonii DSM 18315]
MPVIGDWFRVIPDVETGITRNDTRTAPERHLYNRLFIKMIKVKDVGCRAF